MVPLLSGLAGPLAGSRADERQRLLSVRSRALACNFAAVAAFIGLTVTIAIAQPSTWWPFVVIIGALILGYLFGLSNYGGDEDSAEDAEADQAAPSRVG
jgi:hypothetical protein